MKSFKFPDHFLLVFALNENFHESLLAFAKDQNISTAFYWALGAASSAQLGFYHLEDKDYVKKEFTEELEVTQLVGNLSLKEAQVFPHTRISCGRSDFSMVGGHLFELTVGPTLEVFFKSL